MHTYSNALKNIEIDESHLFSYLNRFEFEEQLGEGWHQRRLVLK